MIDKVVELATGGGARSAIVPADELPARDRILAALREKDIELRDVNDRDAAFAADVGITGADSAVAETGSVYIVTGAGRRPLASLAVTCHIIVVHVSRIVPDLLDWAARQSGDMPANGVFITGPSKTSDIEMILVQGVHGPGEVHVVIVG
jgi:L-lactate utilization protein LutC